MKKNSTGLYLGLGALVLVLILIGVKLKSSSMKPQSNEIQAEIINEETVNTNVEGKKDLLSDASKRTFNLTCNDNYKMTLVYTEAEGNEDTIPLLVTTTNGVEENNYQMYPAKSASGAKYESTEGQFTLWEHQGDFTFSEADEVFLTCRIDEE